MKHLFAILAALTLLAGCSGMRGLEAAGGPPGAPPNGGNRTFNSVSVGTPTATCPEGICTDEGRYTSVPIDTEGGGSQDAVMVEDSDGNVIIGGDTNIVVSDITVGTVDTYWLRTIRQGGAEVVIEYLGPSLSAAPTTWTPATNCRVRSDGTGASPWDADQWVRWNGTAWEAD